MTFPDFEPEDHVGETVAGVRLDEVLGAGSAGAVYRGWVERHGRVAVRLVPFDEEGSRGADRLARELRSGRRLDHPNLVRVLEVLSTGDRVLLLMEYVDGPDLERLLRAGELPIARGARIGAQLARVLDFVHSRGFVHRDVKPSNVLLEPGDRVRLADLEFLKSLQPSPDSALTEFGTVAGSLAYLAPEIVLQDEEPCPATDRYSLGATLYHVFGGRPPHAGVSAVEILKKVLAGPPPPLDTVRPGLPESILAVVSSLMSPDPPRRPASGEDVARQLESVLQAEPPHR